MIKAITQKVYEILSQDATLTALLPDVKDGSNVWEMRVPKAVANGSFPVITFRVTSGAPLLSVRSLEVLSWYIELEVIDNKASTEDVWTIYERVYDLLHNRNLTVSPAIALKCEIDYVNSDYDSNTLVEFVTARFQIYSMKVPSTNVGDLE
jgi:hypothetical protein